MQLTINRRIGILAFLAIFATACGGGGGGATTSTLSITTTDLPVAQVQEFYEAILAAAGGQGTVTWTHIGGALPEGVEFVPASAKLSGTPADGGAFELVFQVRDTQGNTAQVRLSLNINRSPQITLAPFAFVLDGNGQIVPVGSMNAGGTVFLRANFKEEDQNQTTTVLWEQVVPLAPEGVFSGFVKTPLVDNDGNPSATDFVTQVQWTAPASLPQDTEYILRLTITDDEQGTTTDSRNILVKFVPPANAPPVLTGQDWEDEKGVPKNVEIYEPAPFNGDDTGDLGTGGPNDNNFLLLAAEFTDPESETITLVGWFSDDLSTTTPDDGSGFVSDDPDTVPPNGTAVGDSIVPPLPGLVCDRPGGIFCARFRPKPEDLTSPKQYEIRVKVRDIQGNETTTTWLVNVNNSDAGTPPPPNNPPVIGTAPNGGSIQVGSGDDTLSMSVSASDPDGDTLRYWWFVDTPSGLPLAPDCDGVTANWDFVPGANGMSGDAADVVSPTFLATAALVDAGGSGTCDVPVRVSVGDQKTSGIVEQGGGSSATTLEDDEGAFVTLGVCDIDGVVLRPECDFGWFVWNISETPAEVAQIKTVVSETELLLDGAGIVSLMDLGESFRLLACDLGNLATPGDATDNCQEAPTTPATVSVTLAPPPTDTAPNITTSPSMSPSSVVETTTADVSAIAEDVDGPLPLAYWWHAFLTADGTEALKGTFADPTLNATTWTAPAVTIPIPAGAHTLRIDVANVRAAGTADQTAVGASATVLRDTTKDFVALGVLPGWTVRRWDGASWAWGVVDTVGLAGGCFFDGSTLCLVAPGLLDDTGAPGPLFSAADTYEVFNCDLGDMASPGSPADACTVTTDPGQSSSVGFTLVENQGPTADLAYSVLDPNPFNLLVQFDASLSSDPDTSPNPSLSYEWDFDYRDDLAAGGNGDLTLDALDFNSERTTSTAVTNNTFTGNLASYQVAVKVSDGLAADDDIDFVLVLPNQGPEVPSFYAYDQSLQTPGADESGDVLGPPLPVTPTGATVGFSITICDDDALDIVEFDFDYDGVAFTVDSVQPAGDATFVPGTGPFPLNGCAVGLNLYTWEANSAATDGLDGQGFAFPVAGDYRIAARVTDAEGARSLPFCLDTDPASPVDLAAIACPEGTPKSGTEVPVTIGVDHLVSDFTPPDGNASALAPGQHDLESPDGTLFHMVWTDDRACLGAGMPQLSQVYYSRNVDVGLDPAAWSASKNISDGDPVSCSGNSLSPDLVIDPADASHLIVFFSDNRGGDFDIWWVESLDAGLTWGIAALPVPALVRASGPGDQNRPALSIDETVGGEYSDFWHLHFEDTVTGTARQVHALYNPTTTTWGLPSARINSPPQAMVTIDGETAGPAPFTPTLYAEGHPSLGPEFDSYDPEGGALTYEWQWDWSPLGDCAGDPFGDGVGTSTTPTYNDVGFHYLGVRATDDASNMDCAGIWLTSNMGNMPPEPVMRLCQPGTGGGGFEPPCVSLGQLDAGGSFGIDYMCQWDPPGPVAVTGTYDPDFGDDPDLPSFTNLECHWDWDWDGTALGFSADTTASMSGTHTYVALDKPFLLDTDRTLVGMQACDLGDVDSPGGPACAPVVGSWLYVDDYANDPPLALIDTGYTFCTDTEAAGQRDPVTGEFKICLDGRKSFDHEDPDGDIVSWTWDCDAGAISLTEVLVDNANGTATCTYDEDGDYTVDLDVDDSDGLIGSRSITVYVGNSPVNQLPEAEFRAVPVIAELDSAGFASVDFDCRYSVDPDGEVDFCDWTYDGVPGPTADTDTHVFDGGLDACLVGISPAPPASTCAVDLDVTDLDGGVGSESYPYRVIPNFARAPQVAISVSDPSGVATLGVTFAALAVDPDDSTPGILDDCAGCTYTWDLDGDAIFGDDLTATPPLTFYAAEADVTVSVTVTDADGNANTVSTLVTVEHLADNRDPRAFFFYDPSTPAFGTLDSGTGEMIVTVDGRDSDDIDGTIAVGTFVWDCDATLIGGATLTDNLDGTASCEYTVAGDFSLELTVTDNDAAANTMTQTVYVSAFNQIPQAALEAVGGYVRAVGPLSVALDATRSQDIDGSIVLYEWDCDALLTFLDGSGPSPTFTCAGLTGPGTADLSVRVTDDDGDTAIHTITVSLGVAAVNQEPEVLVNYTASQALEMVTNSVFIDASASFDPDTGPTSPPEYFIDCNQGQFTNGVTILFDNPTITCDFTTAATHTVDISVCDSHDGDNTTTPMPCAGNVTTISIDFSVRPNRPPVALAEIDLFSEWAGESTHAALFNNGPSYDPDGDTLASLDWLCSGGGGAGAGASFLCNWFIPGTPVAALTVTDSEGATDVDIHNRVRVTNADPMPLITLSPDGDADLRGLQDHNADLDAAFATAATQDPEGQALTYLWDCGNGTFPATSAATCVYTAPGIYSPSVTATDPHGAAGTTALGTVWVDSNTAPHPVIAGFDDADITTEDNLAWVGDVDHSVFLSAHNSTDHDGQAIAAWVWDCDTGGLGTSGPDFILTDFGNGTATCEYFVAAPYGSGVWTVGLEVFDPAPYSASASTTVDVRVVDHPVQEAIYQKEFATAPGGDISEWLLDIVATADTNLDVSRTIDLNGQFIRYEVDCNYSDEGDFGGNDSGGAPTPADFNVDLTDADTGLGGFNDWLGACGAVLDSNDWPDPASGSVYRGERNIALRACEGSTTAAPATCSGAPDHEFTTVLWRNRVPLAHLGLATGSTVNGPAPHTATLSAANSWDPDNDPILAADLAATEPQWRCDDTGSPPFNNFFSTEAWPYEDWAFADDYNDTTSGEAGLGVTGAAAGDASGDTTDCTVNLSGFSIRPSLYLRDGNPGDEGWSVEACLESNDYDDDAVFDPVSTIYQDTHCANAGGPDGLGTVGGLGTDTGRDNTPQSIFRLTSGDAADLFGITPLPLDLTATVYDPDVIDLVDNSRMSPTGYEWDLMYSRSRLWGGNGDAALGRDDFNLNQTPGPNPTFSLETAGIWRIGLKAATNGTSLAQILATQTAANNGAFLVTGTGEDLLSQPLCKEENSPFAPGNQAAIFVVSDIDAMLFSIGERVNVFDTDIEDPAGDGDGVPFGDTIFTPIPETDGAINATLCDIVQVGPDGHSGSPHAHLYLDGFTQSPESYDFPSAFIQQIAVQKNEPDINYMLVTTDGFIGNLQYQGAVPGSGSGAANPDYHASHRWAESTPLGYPAPAQVGSDDRFVSVSTSSSEPVGIIQAGFDSLPPGNPVHRIQYVRSVYTDGPGATDTGLGWFDFNFEDQLDFGAEDHFGFSDLAGGACNNGENCRNAMSLGNGIRASLEDESHAASGDQVHIAFFNADNTQIRTTTTLGRTFGPTVTVNNIGGSVSSTFPAVSLALDDGGGGPVIMALAWSDTRDGTERIYYACTDDLSTIWPPISYALGDEVALPTRQRQPNVVVRGLEVYSFWTDNRRRGGSYEVFFQSDTCVIP